MTRRQVDLLPGEGSCQSGLVAVRQASLCVLFPQTCAPSLPKAPLPSLLDPTASPEP